MIDEPLPGDQPLVPRLDALPREDDLVVVSGGDPWRLSRLAEAVERLVSGLTAFGVEPGDRVALHLRNGPEIIVAYLACFHIGAIAAPLDARFRQVELEDLLRRLQPRLYLGECELYSHVVAITDAVLPDEARFIVDSANEDRARSWNLLHGDRRGAPTLGRADPAAPVVTLLTSGTTGRPKLVTHSLRTLAEAADRGRYLGLEPGRKLAFMLPMVRISGLWALLAGLRLGVQLITCDADPEAILDTVEEHGCDCIIVLPAIATLLIDAQRRRPRDVSSLRLCLTAGDVPPAGQQDAFEALFHCPLRSFWGSTEATSSFSPGSRPGPVSRLIPGTEMRLVDDQGRDVPAGEPGEMLLRGPHVTLGYWQRPGVVTGLEDGWYRSGDVMRVEDDGHVRFLGRLDDLIVRGGSNISPVEIEQAIASHPAVKEAGVAGVADPVLGQRVMGLVRLEQGMDADVLAGILAETAVQLAEYKMPERLFPVAALPRTALGKVDRRQLAALIEERIAMPNDM